MRLVTNFGSGGEQWARKGIRQLGLASRPSSTPLANNDDWLLRFVKNKQDAVDGWFAENPCSSPDTTQAAKDIIMQGDFDGAKLHLAASATSRARFGRVAHGGSDHLARLTPSP